MVVELGGGSVLMISFIILACIGIKQKHAFGLGAEDSNGQRRHIQSVLPGEAYRLQRI